MLRKATQQELNDLYYDEYADYIYENGDTDCYLICNGDTLLAAMEDCYLWDEFLESKGLTQ